MSATAELQPIPCFVCDLRTDAAGRQLAGAHFSERAGWHDYQSRNLTLEEILALRTGDHILVRRHGRQIRRNQIRPKWHAIVRDRAWSTPYRGEELWILPISHLLYVGKPWEAMRGRTIANANGAYPDVIRLVERAK